MYPYPFTTVLRLNVWFDVVILHKAKQGWGLHVAGT